MSTVYAKTPKGQNELESRTGGLKPKTRRVLIMIDGRRDIDEVTRLSLGDDEAVTEVIRQLLVDGYIDVYGSPATRLSNPLPMPTSALADPDDATTTLPPMPPPSSVSQAPAAPTTLAPPIPGETPIVAPPEKTGPNTAPLDPFGGIIKL